MSVKRVDNRHFSLRFFRDGGVDREAALALKEAADRLVELTEPTPMAPNVARMLAGLPPVEEAHNEAVAV